MALALLDRARCVRDPLGSGIRRGCGSTATGEPRGEHQTVSQCCSGPTLDYEHAPLPRAGTAKTETSFPFQSIEYRARPPNAARGFSPVW